MSKKNFFPLEFPVGKIPQDYIKLQDELTELLDNSKSKLGYGYSVELTTKNTHKYGQQSLPTKISIDSEIDYLKLLNKNSEFSKFKNNIKLIYASVPQLKQWTIKYPLKVIDYVDKWEDLLKVCSYFLAHPKPNLYPRELPIAVHTKFIEENKAIITSLLEAILPPEMIQVVDKKQKHIFEQKFSLKYDEPLVRLRILDSQVKIENNFPVLNLSVPLSEFERINLKAKNCFIAENKMNFLTLPNLKDSFAIWGSGYGIQILRSVSWLCERNIFYWGDIDIDGFKILSQFRGYFPQTISVMMNRDTYKNFERFVVDVELSIPEHLSDLNSEEYDLYSFVCREGKRL
ncbi:MAG: Wadjet anti-phage system protein JetD domain-containing protein [Cyanobacteria bacterium P01_A01_bin.83]